MRKVVLLLMPLFLAHVTAAQKNLPSAKPASKQVIFAVLYDGEGIEPIASLANGKLSHPSATGESDASALRSFTGEFYKPKTTYDLIFGGSPSGKVEVDSSNPASECGKNRASVTVRAPRAVIKGFVMALATNGSTNTQKAGMRRLPTQAERLEIEKLVRSEFKRQKVSTAASKLRYHNLTALDVDGDGEAELIGSFWVASKPTVRNLLFFIAEKGRSDKYSLTHASYERYTPDNIMSGEAKDLDSGIYHELLLDAFDYDADGVSEIFTIARAFEGNNFYVYRRNAGKWVKVFETYNYHCAF